MTNTNGCNTPVTMSDLKYRQWETAPKPKPVKKAA